MNKLLFFVGLFLIGPASATPYFWSIEINGKTVHLLGSIHHGIVIEDLSNSNKIIDSLLGSDLVFLENPEVFHFESDFSENDQKAMIIGSDKKLEKLFEKHVFRGFGCLFRGFDPLESLINSSFFKKISK